MSMNKYRIYVGPIGGKELAQRLRDAGFEVPVVGTEHLHVKATAAALDAVYDVLGWVPGRVDRIDGKRHEL